MSGGKGKEMRGVSEGRVCVWGVRYGAIDWVEHELRVGYR